MKRSGSRRFPIGPRLVAALALGGGIAPVSAYELNGLGWATGPITVHVAMDGEFAPDLPDLTDGADSWNDVTEAGVAIWSGQMQRCKIETVETAEAPEYGNGRSEVYFSDNLGFNVLGITLIVRGDDVPSRVAEADIAINGEALWDSYRGPLNNQRNELRRVVIHETGHLLGLIHPDQAREPQTVNAIMNSTISNTDTITADDVAGIKRIYDHPFDVPAVTQEPEPVHVGVGDFVELNVELDGRPLTRARSLELTLDWFYPDAEVGNRGSNWLFIEDNSRLTLGIAQTYDTGNYTLIAHNPDGAVRREIPVVVDPVVESSRTGMVNLSTRAYASHGVRTLTMGFVIAGSESRRVLLRAVGPTLAEEPFNLADTLENPRLTLNRTGGVGGPVVVAVNDDWAEGGAEAAAEIAEISAAAGAFGLMTGSSDAVILATLEPGTYTAEVSDGNDAGGEGLVIVEAYDVETEARDSRLINLSTRGHVGLGSNLMIAGLVVEGDGPRTYLLRAVGDTLGGLGVNGVLGDTLLRLFHEETFARANDDWDQPLAHQEMLRESMSALGAFPLEDRQESVMQVTLFPGRYSLQLSGFLGDEGVALVEIYEMPVSE